MPKSKSMKRAEAEQRAEIRSKRSDHEQIERLQQRGFVAKKEIKRLVNRMVDATIKEKEQGS